MEKKALFLDLDGTLLNDRKEITDGNRSAIRQALAQGHKVVITTGRPLSSAIQQAELLGMTSPGCYLIAYNGSTIYDMGQRSILFQKTLPLELVWQLFDEANRLGIHIQTYDDTDVLVEPRNNDPWVRRYCQLTRMAFHVIPDVRTLRQEPVKVLLIDFQSPAPLEAFQRRVLAQFSDRLDAFFSCGQYLEVVTTGLSKGSALKQLCQLLDVPLANSYAVGDAANDLSMIRAAGTGVAMVNGTDEVKAAAGYVTRRDNNHDGVAEVIEKFFLA